MLGLLAPLAVAALPFSFTPPPGFRPDQELAHADGDGFGPILEGDSARQLAAVLTDGAGPSASSITISLVEGRLEVDPSERPILANATATYFRTGLDLPFDLDRAISAGSGPHSRIEVWGRATVGDQHRRIVVAYFPGNRRHAIVIGSLDAAREDILAPQMGSALDTFVEDDAPEPWARSRAAISIGVWGLAGLVLAGVGIARRHRDRTDRDKP